MKKSTHTRRWHFRNFLLEIKRLLIESRKALEHDPIRAAICEERARMNHVGISKMKLTPTQRSLAQMEYLKAQAPYLRRKKFIRESKEALNVK